MPLGPNHLLYTKIGSAPPPKGTRMSEDFFQLTQRLIIERAHRFVFGAAQDPQVAGIRPRVVDAMMFRAERAQWERWHQEQSDAELGIFGKSKDTD
jgi:hypothetical protein